MIGITVVEDTNMGLFRKKPLETDTISEAVEPTGDPMSIKYIKGSGGKGDKASYLVGKTVVPASVITRIERACEGKPEQRQSFIIYAALEKKYAPVLEALDNLKMNYFQAIKEMSALKPAKPTGTGARVPKLVKTVEAIAKGVTKRFKGTPKEIVDSFVALANETAFQTELVGILEAFQKQNGLSPTGHIKSSTRKANPKAMKALAAARAKKK